MRKDDQELINAYRQGWDDAMKSLLPSVEKVSTAFKELEVSNKKLSEILNAR